MNEFWDCKVVVKNRDKLYIEETDSGIQSIHLHMNNGHPFAQIIMKNGDQRLIFQIDEAIGVQQQDPANQD